MSHFTGNYLEACQCYEKYLALSQRSGNEKDIGQAYGYVTVYWLHAPIFFIVVY